MNAGEQVIRRRLVAAGWVALVGVVWWFVGFAFRTSTGVLPSNVQLSATIAAGGLLGGGAAGLVVPAVWQAVVGVSLGMVVAWTLTYVGPLAVVSTSPEVANPTIRVALVLLLAGASMVGLVIGVLGRRSMGGLAVLVALTAGLLGSLVPGISYPSWLPLAGLAVGVGASLLSRGWWPLASGCAAVGVFVVVPAGAVALFNSASMVRVGYNPDQNASDIVSYGLTVWRAALFARFGLPEIGEAVFAGVVLGAAVRWLTESPRVAGQDDVPPGQDDVPPGRTSPTS